MFLSDEGPTFKTLDFAFYIGSTPTFLYFDLYFNTAYAAHYILFLSDEGPTLKTLHQLLYTFQFINQNNLYSSGELNLRNRNYFHVCQSSCWYSGQCSRPKMKTVSIRYKYRFKSRGILYATFLILLKLLIFSNSNMIFSILIFWPPVKILKVTWRILCAHRLLKRASNAIKANSIP